jgi:hypothetical protein
MKTNMIMKTNMKTNSERERRHKHGHGHTRSRTWTWTWTWMRTVMDIHYVHVPVCDRVRLYVHIYGMFTCEFYLIPDNFQDLNLTPLPLKFTDTPPSVPHMCPHFSDSSTKWPPSENLFHHTDFLWTDQTFWIAISFKNKKKTYSDSSLPDGSNDTNSAL